MLEGFLEIWHGTAPLIISMPHTGTEIPPEIARRLVSPWLARKDADWHVEKLYAFARDMGASVIRTTVSRSVIDCNRDPSGASLYPGQATTELCPTTTFDGEPLYKGDGPDRGTPLRLVRSLSRGHRGGDRALQQGRTVRRPFHPLAHPAPVRRRTAPSQHRHQQRRDLRSGAGARGGRRGERFFQSPQRPLQGRMDHAALRPPARRRACHPARARHPRLYGRARSSDARELAHALQSRTFRGVARCASPHSRSLPRFLRQNLGVMARECGPPR